MSVSIWKKIGLAAFISTVLLTALYCCFLWGIPYIVDLDKYKETIFQTVEKETGFKVSCEKAEFIKNFKPYLKIHLHHTGILYPDNNIFLQVKDADLRIKTLPLLFKKLEINDVQLERPIINITLYKDFSTSLEKYFTDASNANTGGFVISKSIPVINSQNYKIKFRDESINKTFYLEGNELHLCDLKINDSVHMKIKGAVFENKKEYLKYDLDILTALNKEKQSFTFSPFKSIKESNVKGSIYGHLKTDNQNNINGNLKIINLSLNPGNIQSKNNNANLTFKGKEVEITSVIHTSNKDAVNINGKFNFGKKRYIDLNTNAKNINLENLFKIISETTKILNIENPLNNLSAKGLLNADFNIQSDFKKLKSKGIAQIINASIAYKDLPYPISNINAHVNFNNNEIKIENAQANVKNTPIELEGSVKNDLTSNLKVYSDNLDLKTIIQTFMPDKNIPIEITNGNLHFETEITGNLGKDIKTLSDIIIKDLSFKEKSSKIPINARKCIINLIADGTNYNGNINIENANMEFNKKFVKIPKLDLNFDDKNINVLQNKIILINSPIEIDGYIANYNSKPTAKFDFIGNIYSNDAASIFSSYINQPYKAEGRLNTKGIINYENDKLKINAKIKADKDNYISYLVIQELLNKPSVTSIDIEADKKLINIKDLSLTHNNDAFIKVAGQLYNEKEIELKNINLNIPNIITAASNFFGGEEISFKSNLTINGNINKPQIKGNTKILKYNLKKYLTSIKNADINFSPENIRITAPDVMVNNSYFNIVADLIPDFNNIIFSNVQMNSLNLDLNSLFKLIQKEQSLFAKSLITVKNGSATINKFQILDLKAHDISSDFKLEKNILKISNINANSYSGTVNGKANYEFTTGILDIDMTGKNLNIKNSLYDLCKLDDNLSGQADVKAKISLMTGPYSTALKTLSGSMEFNARNGSMGTLGKFEYYLYAQNLLYHGLLNTSLNRIIQTISHDDTAHYNLSDGKILFQNGYIITDDIHTQGEKMSLYIKGRHNLFTNQTNIDIYGRISDEISKKLGNFGDVSISELVNGQKSKKDNVVMIIPNSVINEIKPLYNRNGLKTNTFKVNVSGNIKALNAINSFTWIVPDNFDIPQQDNVEEQEKLPDFTDL